MKVSDMMHEFPVCCSEVDTAQRAAELMKEHHAGALPVVELKNGGKVIGVVTDRDICLRVVAEARDPLKVQIRKCMTSAPVCCGPNDDVQYALLLMREHHVRRIPVVEKDGSICGMISFANLVMNHVDPSQLFEMIKAVSLPTPEAMQVRPH
jgi:CBS domain-containing protein